MNTLKVRTYLIFKYYIFPLFQTLGNHEFDHGISPLLSYLNGIQGIPTVVSNLNMTAEPELNNFILPSLVRIINNTKVGIVGCLTTDTLVIIMHLLTSDECFNRNKFKKKNQTNTREGNAFISPIRFVLELSAMLQTSLLVIFYINL